MIHDLPHWYAIFVPEFQMSYQSNSGFTMGQTHGTKSTVWLCTKAPALTMLLYAVTAAKYALECLHPLSSAAVARNSQQAEGLRQA